MSESDTGGTEQCDRCGGQAETRPVDNPYHDKLCDSCFEWENQWRVRTKWGSNSPTSGAGYRTVRVQANSKQEAAEKAREELSFVESFTKFTVKPPRNNRSLYTDTDQ